MNILKLSFGSFYCFTSWLALTVICWLLPLFGISDSSDSPAPSAAALLNLGKCFFISAALLMFSLACLIAVLKRFTISKSH